MKILISVSYYAPHVSGLTNSIKNLVELLAQNGYTINVLTTQHDKKLPLHSTKHTISIRRVPYLMRLHKGFFMPSFLRVAYKEIKKADQVLITLPQFEGVFVAILAKILGKRVHCIYVCEVTLARGLSSTLIENLLRFSNRICLCLADSVITLTDDFAHHNETLKSLHKKIIGIYPVIIPPICVKEQQIIVMEQLRANKKQYVIGFLGRISAEKGIQYLLEAIPFLEKELDNNFIIALGGPKDAVGEDEYRQKIEALILHYKKYIVQLGELPDASLGAFYSSLDVFVLPSINQTEAFGMVQVESMLCGTPVVVSDLPGVRVPVLKTGMGEVVSLKDGRSIADAIKKVLIHKKRYVMNKSVIQEEFSNKKIINAYTTIFTSD